MTNSPNDNVENFTHDLVDKLVLQAMDILDANLETNFEHRRGLHVNCAIPGCSKCKGRKNRNLALVMKQGECALERSVFPHGDQDSSSDPSQFPRVYCGDLPSDVDPTMQSEEIREMVEGFGVMQIGDSSAVKKIEGLSNLEIEVKRAVEEMRSGGEIVERNEVSMSEGQGDVRGPISQEAVSISLTQVNEQTQGLTCEASGTPTQPDNSDSEKPNAAQPQEVSKLRSTCFLHRIIKELEDAENQENLLVTDSMSEVSKERIEAWEESEEKLIRTTESEENDGRDFSPRISPLEGGDSDLRQLEIPEMNSQPEPPAATSSPAPPKSLPPAPDDTQTLEDATDSTLQRDTNKMEKPKAKKNTRLGQRLRRFFRFGWKRRKDC